jgi:two-component system NtrC family response regulator
MKNRILLVDDDKNFRKVTALALEKAGYGVTTAVNGEDGLAVLQTQSPDVILCDLNMPVMDGLTFLGELKRRGIEVPVVVITAYGSIEKAVEAMQAGAFNFVTKPINRQELRLAVDRAGDVSRLRKENRFLREKISGGRAVDRLVGASDVMESLRNMISRLAESSAPVLVTGESGTGKELVARALHYDGPRAERGAFVVLNCAAVPGELLESLLFGHRKGAFTGATSDREGKFEAADGGTLFLDEIGDMPMDLQAKLLRVLQEGEIERIGDTTPRPIDVRVVSATNQPLVTRIEEGAFRQDLYYRLAVVPIEVPPLRERLNDLGELLNHFLDRHGAGGAVVPEATLEELKTHPWPGNVRELENLIMRVCALNPGFGSLDLELVQAQDGPRILDPGVFDPKNIVLPEGGVAFEDVERGLLEAAWEHSGHNQTRAARFLRMPRQAFSYRLQKYGIIPKHGSGDGSDD